MIAALIRFGRPRFATCIALGALLLSPPAVMAAVPDSPLTFDQVVSKWTVAPDATWAVDAEVTLRAPDDNPSHVVRMPLSWSTSIERLRVIQARIDKPDGRQIVLPTDAIREDPPTGDEYFHEFSDEDRLIITFSDAEAGDSLVVKTRREVFHPRVPGGFMAAPVLNRSVDWEETNYSMSVPADMPFHFETRVFDHESETIRDRIVHYFHSPKVTAPPREVSFLGPFDRLPRFAVSTFRDWDAFAKAYGAVFLPHARVTPAIAALAAKLTEGMPDRVDQARAIYLWVRDHVRYIPVPLEQSRPEPHDAEQVMTNLYGDAKDHVVLLHALLAARNIASEIVLLNATDEATIADPPNIRPMNHLIVYIPGLDTYVDTTLDVAPFGVLSFPEIGKPAIHLDGSSGPARRDIPLPPSGATLSDMKTDITLDANGDISGTTTTKARGAFGVWLRGEVHAIGKDNPAAAVALLRQHGTPGTGMFTFDEPASPKDDYTVSGTFRLTNQAALLRGGYFAPWTGLRLLPRPGDFLAGPMFLRDQRKVVPTFCYPGVQNETISVLLPEGRVLGGVPRDVSINTELVRYRSHWSVQDRRVTVSRQFQSLAPKLVCEGPTRDDMADVLDKIRADMVTPVGIRQDEAPALAPNASVPDQ